MYATWKFLHLLGVIGFVGAHGTSASVALRLRKERDRPAIGTLLALSRSTRPVMYASLLLVVVSGAVTASEIGAWSSAWLLWSIVLLVLMIVAAIVLAVPYYGKIRRAIADDSQPADTLDGLLRSPIPLIITVLETVGVVAIVWLMVAKP